MSGESRIGRMEQLMKATLPIFNLNSLSLSIFPAKPRETFSLQINRPDRASFAPLFRLITTAALRERERPLFPDAIDEFATIKESFDAPSSPHHPLFSSSNEIRKGYIGFSFFLPLFFPLFSLCLSRWNSSKWVVLIS